MLGLEFGKLLPRDQVGTAKEKWELRWTPEAEIQLVEAALKGDTVELAAAMRLSERLAECERVDQAAELVKEAADCQLADALEDARRRLQSMAVLDSAFDVLAKAIDNLAEIVNYGSVRKIDPAPLRPLLAQLFLKATLQVRPACGCDEDTAREKVKPAIVVMNRVSMENAEDVDSERWNRELDGIAASDALNAYLSGFACAVGLERGRIAEEELAREVSRRMSPGIDAELGAGWFEGLVSYNRQALFSRLGLWHSSTPTWSAWTRTISARPWFIYAEPSAISPRARFGESCQTWRRFARRSRGTVGHAETKLDDEEAKKLQDMLGDLQL